MELKAFLRTLPAFESFSESYVDALIDSFSVNTYDAGHTFIDQGSQGEALYLIINGGVRVSYRDEINGQEREIKELRSGEMFGLLSLLSDIPAAATCTAVEPVTAASLPRQEFEKLARSAPPINNHLLYMIAVQLARDLQDRNRSLRSLLKRAASATN
ncbi:MAG TPA: cyclic nucleotide-binding domain-containing protein [Burkholderiales bacterium]|nr:cyclic nucleotide-binding domain-containing protein [Burkholderiales bacterium]